jgi:SH3-like domain-containing protein
MKKFASLWVLSAALAVATLITAYVAQADTLVVAQAPVMTGGHGTILKDKVNVRSRPDKTSEVITQVHKGDAVEVLDRKGEWVRVPLPASAKCYVAAKLIQDGAATADAVNIRCGRGTNYKDVGKLAKGEKVTTIKTEGEWLEIKPTPHCTGWIAAEYVEIAAPTPAPAPITTTSEVVTPPVAEPVKATSAMAIKPVVAPDNEVHVQYIVKDGFVGAVQEAGAPAVYALMTPEVLSRQYIVAYLETSPDLNLARCVDKHVRVFGNQRWRKSDRYPVITVERIDRVW